MKKKLILKVGTSTLTSGTDRISYAKIEDIARQIVSLRHEYDVVIVSSGAIAMARQYVDINDSPLKVDSKQALAAIGQPKLMTIYDEVFGSFGLKAAQCLLVHRDFDSETARKNVANTVNKLLEYGYTPVINENDTVAVDEIVLGDNDKLSALVAVITGANLLVLASDVDGLFDKNPNKYKDAVLVEVVDDIDDITRYIDDMQSDLGTGGMRTKIEAARICRRHSVEMWILNGFRENFLVEALKGRRAFTRVLPLR